jgi:hypothetical protein
MARTVMKPVQLHARLRHAGHVEGRSQREALRQFDIAQWFGDTLLRT